MRVIDLPRGFGKTRSLVDFMLRKGNEDVIYIAPTMKQAENAHHMAVMLGPIEPPLRERFVSASSRRVRDLGPNDRVVIDELAGVLTVLLGNATVELGAMTSTDVQHEKVK